MKKDIQASKGDVLALNIAESLDLFKRVVDNAPDGIQIVGIDGRVRYSNKAVTRIYGYSAKELEKMYVNKMNADPTFATKVILPAIKKTGSWTGELLVKHKKGYTFPIWLTSSMIFGTGGKPQAMVGIIHDLTNRKKVEQKLRESEENYRTIVEASKDMIWTLDKNGCVLFVNTAAEKFGGYSLEDLRGKDFSLGMKKEDIPSVYGIFKKTLKGVHQDYEASIYRKNGDLRVLSVSTSPIYVGGKIIGTVSFGEDITESKKIEADLLKFKLGLERSSEAVFITDIDGKITHINPAFEKIYGYSKKEAIGKTPRILKSGLIPDAQYKQFWDALLSKKVVAGEIMNKRKDGTLLNIDGSNNPIIDNSGNIIGFLAIHRDITERKKAEEEKNKLDSEIHAKVAELERFEKLAVGRELKMIELKNKIVVLEKKLGLKQKQKV